MCIVSIELSVFEIMMFYIITSFLDLDSSGIAGKKAALPTLLTPMISLFDL